MNTEKFFAQKYGEARDKFLSASHLTGAETKHYTHPLKTPDGQSLSTDIAWIGPKDARKVLVIISGTHGVEGFCGSGIQIGWMLSLKHTCLPADTACLLVHAINPYGFAWLRRVTEDGVDLNRNFVDPEKPKPENPFYDKVADAIIPAKLQGKVIEDADAHLARVQAEVGELNFFRSIAAGQYTHPEGLFYGGVKPTWSNNTTHEIIATFLSRRDEVVVIDLHSGLGPYGYGELLINYPADSPPTKRALQLWGENVATSLNGNTMPFVKDGPTHYSYMRALKHIDATFSTLEFGTFRRQDGFKALRADHWLHKYGDPSGPEADAIKKGIRRQYYPDTMDWKEAVFFRGSQIINMALSGLSGEQAERA